VGMWVDTFPSDVSGVVSAIHDTSTTTTATIPDISSATKGRKRAIDFM